MTFSNAVNNMSAANATRDAAKIPEWKGYVYKSVDDMSDADVTAGKFKLIFVKSDGDQYVYTWGGTTSPQYDYTGHIAAGSNKALGTGDPDSTTKLIMDEELLAALAVDTWDTGAQATFDDQRVSATGVWN